MTSLVEHSPPTGRTRALALLRLAVNLGMAFGPAAGGWLAAMDYRWLFIGDALTCWAAAIFLLLTSRGFRPVTVEEVAESGTTGRPPWKDGSFLAFLFLVMVLATIFFQVWSTLPLYLREVFLLPEHLIGMMFSINALLIVTLEMPLVRMLEKRNMMLIIGVGCLLIGSGLGIMPFGTGAWFVVLTVLVWSVGEMLALPFMNSVVARKAGPGTRGRYMGAYATAFSLAFVFAPAAGTAVYQRLGPDLLWFSAFCIGVTLLAGFALLGRWFLEPRT
jgi:MFS family permease